MSVPLVNYASFRRPFVLLIISLLISDGQRFSRQLNAQCVPLPAAMPTTSCCAWSQKSYQKRTYKMWLFLGNDRNIKSFSMQCFLCVLGCLCILKTPLVCILLGWTMIEVWATAVTVMKRRRVGIPEHTKTHIYDICLHAMRSVTQRIVGYFSQFMNRNDSFICLKWL